MVIQKCQEHFGCSPKEEQIQVVEHVWQQKDCLLLAPCGWGKTLVFSLPMVIWDKSVTAVISPLIALMKEQIKVPCMTCDNLILMAY